MSIEKNKEVARRFYDEVLNEGKIDALDDMVAADYEEHDMLPGQRTGRDGVKDRVNILRGAFRPVFTIEDVIAEDDRVMVRWTNAGSHVGEFMGIPPTNKDVAISGIDVYRVQNGKLTEHWHEVDQLSMLQQLGLVPGP
jgi:steroid delta-isomerase-like uncharacterized protein